MKPLILGILLLATAGIAHAVPTREEALAAIATLEKNLMSDAALDAARTITEFAKDSDEVVFTLSPDLIPWVVDERPENEGDETINSLLLAVYLAGNAKSQLASGKTEDDPYSGWVEVLKAYRRLQARHPIKIPSLDKFSEMEAKGTLEQHARELKAGETRSQHPTDPASRRRDASF